MTLDRIHEFYENTYFCRVSKWGKTLTKEEAKYLGLPLDSEESEAPKAPIRRTRKNSKATTTNKEGIE